MSNILKDSLTESKFNMWRACVAVIFLDGKVTKEEDKWVRDKIKYIPFNKEQENLLLNDLENGVDIYKIVPLITDKKDRAFLLHQVRIISYLDKDFSKEERQFFKTLEDAILKNLDLDVMESLIEKMELDSYHEDNVYKVYNKNSIFEKTAKSFIKLINTDDYSGPDDLI